ncbi:MAG: hypothetical protein ACRDMH_03235 [Solirubrobacterales bacterium]
MNIELNQEAIEALDRDAIEQMTNAARELVFARQHGNDESEFEQTILACAEVHGALHWSKLGNDTAPVAVEFSERAQTWLARERKDVADYMADLDAGVNEPDQERVSWAALLLHTLDRIVGQPVAA